jgi:excisionase family DNA binding protein
MEAQAMKEKLHTVTELSEMFGVSRQTIHNWIGEGRFPNHVVAGEGRGSVVLIPASDVDRVKEEEAEKLREQLARLGFQTQPA